MKGFAYIKKDVADWIDVDIPEIGPLDALVEPMMISPCTSDIHNVEFGYVQEGIILGHEGIGKVIKVGFLVKDFKPGDIVAISPLTPDFGTVLSQKGVPMHCNGPMTGNLISNKVHGLMAEYCRVPNADMNLAFIPDGVSYTSAVMAGDMMSTGFFAAEQANIQYGDTVVVIGIGAVGLMAILGAKLRGAGRIIAIGSRPKSVELAKYYGASEIVNYKDGDITKQVFSMTDRQGADSCIIAGGSDDALNQGIAMVRYGGTVSNVNYFTTTGNLQFSNPKWGFGMSNKQINCGLTSGGRARMDSLLALIKYGRADLEPLVTHKLSGFDKTPDAFNIMKGKGPDVIKVCVEY